MRKGYAPAGFPRLRGIDGGGTRGSGSTPGGMQGMRGTVERGTRFDGKPCDDAAGRGSDRFGRDSTFAMPQRARGISGRFNASSGARGNAYFWVGGALDGISPGLD